MYRWETSQDGIILINSNFKFPYFKFPFEVLSLKQLSKVSVQYCFQEYLIGNVLQIIINPSVVALFFSKIPCFQHILMNTVRRMRLNY